MVKPTVPLKLLTEVIVIVELIEAPAATFKTDGETESENPGAGGEYSFYLNPGCNKFYCLMYRLPSPVY
jgi:hypothetical protein